MRKKSGGTQNVGNLPWKMQSQLNETSIRVTTRMHSLPIEKANVLPLHRVLNLFFPFLLAEPYAASEAAKFSMQIILLFIKILEILKIVCCCDTSAFQHSTEVGLEPLGSVRKPKNFCCVVRFRPCSKLSDINS